MKKTAIIILALALVLCIGATSALAAGGWEGRGLYCQASNSTCPAGDGSCLYAGQNCPNENCPTGGFTDLDGDGVCDHNSSARHCGQGGGHHGGHWN